MNPSTRINSLDPFLGSLHRRMVVMRVLEHGGTGILMGSVASLIVVPILLWQNQPAIPFVSISIILGAIAGIAWGVARRPTRVAAAIEADRQLQLSDLLSTALSIRQTPGVTNDAPWTDTILALAEHRLTTASPRDVLMRRWGVRAWSGTLMAVMLAVTLSIFSPATDTTRAATENNGSRAATRRASITELPPLPPPMSSSTSTGHHPPRGSAGPDESGNRQIGGEEHADEKDSGGADQTASPSSGSDGSGALNSAGSGNARGNPVKSKETSPRAPGIPGVKSQTAGSAKPRAAGGSGTATDGTSNASSKSDDAALAGVITAGVAIPTAPPPPWKQSGWSGDAARARDAINTGRVPDGYRDLVRDYFDEAR